MSRAGGRGPLPARAPDGDSGGGLTTPLSDGGAGPGDDASLTAVLAPPGPAFLSRSAEPSADRPSGLAFGLGRPRDARPRPPGDLAGGDGGWAGRVAGESDDGDAGALPDGDGGGEPGGRDGDAVITSIFSSAFISDVFLPANVPSLDGFPVGTVRSDGEAAFRTNAVALSPIAPGPKLIRPVHLFPRRRPRRTALRK